MASQDQHTPQQIPRLEPGTCPKRTPHAVELAHACISAAATLSRLPNDHDRQAVADALVRVWNRLQRDGFNEQCEVLDGAMMALEAVFLMMSGEPETLRQLSAHGIPVERMINYEG